MKTLKLALLGLLITGCATGYNPRFNYNHIQVANLTGETITNLKIQVGPEGRVLECAEITDKRICEDRFGSRLFPQEVIEVSWQNASGDQQMITATPAIPATFNKPNPLRLMADVKGDGMVEVYVRQETTIDR